jgi:hypothetical protein
VCCYSAGKAPAYSGRKSHHCLEFSVKPFIAAVLAIAIGALAAGCAGTGSASNNGDRATSSSGSGVTVFGTIDAGVSGSTNRSERR